MKPNTTYVLPDGEEFTTNEFGGAYIGRQYLHSEILDTLCGHGICEPKDIRLDFPDHVTVTVTLPKGWVFYWGLAGVDVGMAIDEPTKGVLQMLLKEALLELESEAPVVNILDVLEVKEGE